MKGGVQDEKRDARRKSMLFRPLLSGKGLFMLRAFISFILGLLPGNLFLKA